MNILEKSHKKRPRVASDGKTSSVMIPGSLSFVPISQSENKQLSAGQKNSYELEFIKPQTTVLSSAKENYGGTEVNENRELPFRFKAHRDPSSTNGEDEVFYETSPVQCGFDEIQSMEATKFFPTLREKPDLPVEADAEPFMSSPLLPINAPLDLKPLKYDQQVNYLAPLSNTIDIEDAKGNDEVSLLYIWDHEFELLEGNIPQPESNPKRSLVKKFWHWIADDLDDDEYFEKYYCKYPWTRYIGRYHGNSTYLNLEGFDDSYSQVAGEYFF